MIADHAAPTADIVFDLDGVLVDTERLKFGAHRTAVETAGGRLESDDYRRGMGRPHDEVIRLFLDAAGLPADPGAAEAYEERFRADYRRRLEEELAPTAGAEALLAACRREGRRLALVTSSDPWMVEIVLGRLGWAERFEAVVTAADVEAEKPDPEPYRRALAALRDAGEGSAGRPGPDDAAPAAGSVGAVAVEDTGAGVASAAGAGLPVVAVRHAFNGRHDFGRAAAVVDGLAPADDFLALADRLAAGAAGGT